MRSSINHQLIFFILIINLFCLSVINAQHEDENLYLQFWFPNLYNASLQSPDSLIVINSVYAFQNKTFIGFQNMHTSASIPIINNRARIGINTHAYQNRDYHRRDAGIFFNYKLKLWKKFYASLGIGPGMRSTEWFLENRRFIAPMTIVEPGFYHHNYFILNYGITFYWKRLYLGVGCRNCRSEYYGTEPFDVFYEYQRQSFQAGGDLHLDKNLRLELHFLLREKRYFTIFDSSLTAKIYQKHYLGFSLRNGQSSDVAFHAGYKWKMFWLLGVFQPKKRKEQPVFEIAAQMQILQKN